MPHSSSAKRATGTGRSRREAVSLERRRREVSALYLAGKTQAEIAKKFGVARSVITIDLQILRAEWRATRVGDMTAIVGRELDRIDHVELEAWAAWERSQEPAEQTTVTKSSRSAETTKQTRGQCGDPRFLAIVNQCIEHRRKLLGLDQPTKTAITADVSVDTRFLGREEMRRQVVDRLKQITAGKPAENPKPK